MIFTMVFEAPREPHLPRCPAHPFLLASWASSSFLPQALYLSSSSLTGLLSLYLILFIERFNF